MLLGNLAFMLFAAAQAGGAEDLAVHTLSDNGSTRGTAYAASNKVVTLGNRSHIAWLDANAATWIRTYDRKTHAFGDPVEVGQGHDNHGGPSLCADSEGHLHIVYGPHHYPFQYRRSLRPNDVTEWTPVERFTDKATYPSMVCDSQDTLHLVYRQSDKIWRMMYQRKPKGGPWSEPVTLLDGPGPGYTQYGNSLHIDKNDRIHLGFHVYAVARNKKGFAFAYWYSDDHGGTWRTPGGEPLALPTTPETCRPIETHPEMDIRAWNVVAAPDGSAVYLTVSGKKPERGEAGELWILRGGKWSTIDLTRFLEAPWNRVSSPSVSLGGDGALYIAAECGPPFWGAAGKDIWLLTSRDEGKSFTAQPVSVTDPELPNWLPNLERNMGHAPFGTPCLVFTHGGPGKNNKEPLPTEIQFVEVK